MLQFHAMNLDKIKNNKKIRLQPSGAVSSGPLLALDSSDSKNFSSVSQYITIQSETEETSGFKCKKNVQITPDSHLSTITKAELDGKSIKISLVSQSTIISFKRLKSGNFSATFSGLAPVYISEAMIKPNAFGKMADLDFIIQMMARKIFGENIQLRARDGKIKDIWRQIRTLLKHKK